jgi:hypothetical protein
LRRPDPFDRFDRAVQRDDTVADGQGLHRHLAAIGADRGAGEVTRRRALGDEAVGTILGKVEEVAGVARERIQRQIDRTAAEQADLQGIGVDEIGGGHGPRQHIDGLTDRHGGNGVRYRRGRAGEPQDVPGA